MPPDGCRREPDKGASTYTHTHSIIIIIMEREREREINEAHDMMERERGGEKRGTLVERQAERQMRRTCTAGRGGGYETYTIKPPMLSTFSALGQPE